jgi:hypothetical protein
MTDTEAEQTMPAFPPYSWFAGGHSMRWRPPEGDVDVPVWSWLVPGLDDGTVQP